MSQYMSIRNQQNSSESETDTSFSFPNVYSSPSPQTPCSGYTVTPSNDTPSYVYHDNGTPNSCSSLSRNNKRRGHRRESEITGQFPSINLEDNFDTQTTITLNDSVTITPKRVFHDRSRTKQAPQNQCKPAMESDEKQLTLITDSNQETAPTEETINKDAGARDDDDDDVENDDTIEIVFNPCVDEEALEQLTLFEFGYKKEKFLIDTLQGSVYIARVTDNHQSFGVMPKTVVIKRTSKKLHEAQITILKDGSKIRVQENIIREAQIMKTLNQSNPPCSMIKYFQFFEDELNYYLVMENGGSSFFQFVVKCHGLIEEGKLKITEWRKQCKFMFAQCVQFIQWMHSKGFCNLDISLENLLISHECRFNEKNGKLSKCYVKFIDFGLSEQFADFNFECTKYVGKTLYKSPQVYKRKYSFDARKADTWSLGVVLFMMMVGCPPYNKPCDDDLLFGFLKRGETLKLLQQWGRVKYLTGHSLDLLNRIFVCNESRRYSMDQVCQHQWIFQYFIGKYNSAKTRRIGGGGISASAVHALPSLTSLYSPNLCVRNSQRHNKVLHFASRQVPKIVIPQSNSSIASITYASLPASPPNRSAIFDN